MKPLWKTDRRFLQNLKFGYAYQGNDIRILKRYDTLVITVLFTIAKKKRSTWVSTNKRIVEKM